MAEGEGARGLYRAGVKAQTWQQVRAVLDRQAENIADEAGPSLLHRLIGRSVRSLTSEGLVLTISFDDGAQLRIFSDLEPYEAGTIDGEGGLIAF